MGPSTSAAATRRMASRDWASCEAAAPRRGSIAEDDRHRIGVDVAVPSPGKTSVQALEFEAERAIKANGGRIVGKDRELNLAQIGAKLRSREQDRDEH